MIFQKIKENWILLLNVQTNTTKYEMKVENALSQHTQKRQIVI